MSRIPSFLTPRQWATDMHNAGLTYHYEDKPEDIDIFTAEECNALRSILSKVTAAQLAEVFDVSVELHNAPEVKKTFRKVLNSYQVSEHRAADTDARGKLIGVYRTKKQALAKHPEAVRFASWDFLPKKESK